MVDVKELKILNRKDCQCGMHEFSLKDVKGIEPLIDAHGFYGNLVKNYAAVQCPKCHNITVLLLKQVGQTWDIMNTAIIKNIQTEQTKNKNQTENKLIQEFICPKCQRTFKNKLGLNSHMRTHQN